MKQEELFIKAINKWGLQKQMLMLVEELGELQHAVIKAIRNNQEFTEEMAEEWADTEIMLAQMRHYWTQKMDLDEILDEFKNKKLKRLEQLLGE